MARPTKPKASSTPQAVETKPKKRVMFLIPHESTKPIALSPLQPAPSPAYSQSSLPTTSGALTPSSTTTLPPHAFSPVHRKPTAPATIQAPSIHDLLSSPTGVVLDISRPPHPDVLRIHPTHLIQYATFPPVRSLKLVSPGLPWTISVQPTTSSVPHVTVLDVLHALYTNLHKPVKQVEFDAYSRSQRDAISATWFRRLDQIPHESMRINEKQKGLRRVDFLLGRPHVKGLSLSVAPINGDTAWIVDFGT